MKEEVKGVRSGRDLACCRRIFLAFTALLTLLAFFETFLRDSSYDESQSGVTLYSSAQEEIVESTSRLRLSATLNSAIGGLPASGGSVEKSRTATAAFRSFAQRNATDPACSVFKGAKKIAVVGNGPLSMRQRIEIMDQDRVVRFNMLNNMWREEERIDVWVVRYGHEAKHRFWGFEQLGVEESMKVLDKIMSVWFVVAQDHDWAVSELLRTLPGISSHRPLTIYQNLYSKSNLNVRDGGEFFASPSTGFIGIAEVLACAEPSAKLHIFGMNWAPGIWKGHDMAKEAAFVRMLEKEGTVQIHHPPCRRMRSCNTRRTIDCHFDRQKKLFCRKEGKKGAPLPRAMQRLPQHDRPEKFEKKGRKHGRESVFDNSVMPRTL